MSTPAPIMFRWDGEAMVPRHPRLADKAFVIGQEYPLVEHHGRSEASHRHYFACIHDAWQNLPADAAERFATSEHLRKWALIKAGYRDERTIVLPTKADAQRVAAFMKPDADCSVVVARECVVVCWTAKSQSVRAMGKADFQASKDAVLQVVAELIGAQPDQLGRAA